MTSSVIAVSVGRSDYSIYRRLLRVIDADPSLSLDLVLSGAHLAPEFGGIREQVYAEEFSAIHEVPTLLAGDSAEAVAKSIGVGVVSFGQLFSGLKPDLLLVLGDRFEMLAAVVAAVPHAIPIGHIHGGESSEGAFDEGIRHAISKLSHLHFVSTQAYADRLVRMGEEPWRITVSGAPAIDALLHERRLSRPAVEELVGIPLDSDPLVVTFHPETLSLVAASVGVRALLDALEDFDFPIIFTRPNEDPGSEQILKAIVEFVERKPNCVYVSALGPEGYFGLMQCARAMVGNSSSGIIEAASLELPVVDIGYRQRGRIRGKNVIHTEAASRSIRQALDMATDPAFRASIRGIVNPYGDGHAVDRIVERLAEHLDRQRLLDKRFYDAEG